jgi:hypothetical protein
MESAGEPLADSTVFGPRPPDLYVSIQPRFQLVCEQCGPLDGGLHGSMTGAVTDRDAHMRSHAAGEYLVVTGGGSHGDMMSVCGDRQETLR